MIRRLSLELKIIVGIIVFTIFIVEFQRFQLSENVLNQFVVAKQSKNDLLINTITPIVTLHISLGLDDANKEYLDNIAKTTHDVKQIKIFDAHGNAVYHFSKVRLPVYQHERNTLNYTSRTLHDTLTQRSVGTIEVDFFDDDYQTMQDQFLSTTIKIYLFTFLAMLLLLMLVKREFKHLKNLSESVISYDPAKNNFLVLHTNRTDEVGIIQNALVMMVSKIGAYAKLLDETNKSLETKVKERTQALEKANMKLKHLSTTDTLTQLPNRRSFEGKFQSTWELAKREKVTISVIICDIDHFKQVNDTYGHITGDVVLQQLSHVLKSSIKRSTDFVARYGGEEFIIILYGAESSYAIALCETIQHNMLSLRIPVDQHEDITGLTFSFGIHTLMPNPESSQKYAIKRADDALYLAKQRGRNRIEVY